MTVGQSLENDRDVLKILTSYRRVAGKDFGAELDRTIADMKTGNYENALIRFETRIGSPMLSDVIRGLIGVLRGDDQRMYFKMITFDMRQIEQNNLKRKLPNVPKKIQRYSMMMLICIMIIYLVVLCTEVMSSLRGILWLIGIRHGTSGRFHTCSSYGRQIHREVSVCTQAIFHSGRYTILFHLD